MENGSLGLAPPTIMMSRVESFLLLQLLVELHVQATDHQCSNAVFPSYTNNPILRVRKSTGMYQVTLQTTAWQYSNDICLVADHKDWTNFMRNSICGACQ